MRPKLLLLDKPCEKAIDILQEVFEITYSLSQAEAIWTGLTPITIDKPVFCPCTSVEHIKASEIIHLDNKWKQGEGRKITSTAEHTWSLILQLAKLKRMQLSGKTVGVIGYGRIGQQIYKYAEAFNLNCLFLDIDNILYKNAGILLSRLVKLKSNNELVELSDLIYEQYDDDVSDLIFEKSDIITLHVPLNESTKGMIGKREFELMKDGAILVNTSRAEIVDYDALMKCEDKIYYADDFSDTRPLNRKNTIQTHHIAGSSIEAREATDIYIAKKAVEYWRSKNP